jgi:hypothetical protein
MKISADSWHYRLYVFMSQWNAAWRGKHDPLGISARRSHDRTMPIHAHDTDLGPTGILEQPDSDRRCLSLHSLLFPV